MRNAPLAKSEVESDHSEVDLSEASPEEIKAEIASTRELMNDHLSQLGRKFKPRLKPAYLWISLTGFIFGVGAYLVYRNLRHRSLFERWTSIMARLPFISKRTNHH